MSVNYYQLLGVAQEASANEIKKAYQRQMLRHHPDKHRREDDPIAPLLNTAYAVLSHPDRRREYDCTLTNGNGRSRAHDAAPSDGGPGRVDSQSARRTSVACPKCGGSGRTRFLNATCPRCRGRGQLVEVAPPPGRNLCPTCRGLGYANGWDAIAMGLGIGHANPCGLCEGSGLHPLPQVSRNPCRSCNGFGFHQASDPLRGDCRQSCPACGGSGQAGGMGRIRCKRCDGHGFNQSFGVGWPCHYCDGRGWVPGRKF